MIPAAAEQLARSLMVEFDLQGWSFTWDRSVARFGRCNHGKRLIGLSRPLTELNTVFEVEDVLRHEIAHAIAPATAGHGRAWVAACRITGARPERCYDEAAVKRPPAPLRVVCPACGWSAPRRRRIRSGTAYHCDEAQPVRWERVS